jgi:hypothetical protein
MRYTGVVERQERSGSGRKKSKGAKYFNFFIPSTAAAAPFLPLPQSRIPPFP